MEHIQVSKSLNLSDGVTYEELRKLLIDNIIEIEQEVWEIDMNKFKLPLNLSESEIFDLVKFIFLREYKQEVSVSVYSHSNTIFIECDRIIMWQTLAFILIPIFIMILILFIKCI